METPLSSRDEDAKTLDLPRGLAVGPRNKAAWDQPAARRQGLRVLHRLHRYGMSFGAPRVLPLEVRADFRLHDLDTVRWYLGHPFHTALAVLKGERILLEHYAADFGPDAIHSIQSITKTSVHLIAGRLIEEGRLDPTTRVGHYLPEIGSGYFEWPVQDLLDMAVVNDYSEDFYDPAATVGLLEDAHGWRIIEGRPHVDIRAFLKGIEGPGRRAGARTLDYKTANTDVLAWICELVSGVDLRDHYLHLVEAVGAESTVYLSTDRRGTPFAGGGLHMTLRDLARYGLLLARGGVGVDNSRADGPARVGSPAFRDATRAEYAAGTPSLLGRGNYRNFVETNGTWLGHNGYGGQWLMVFPEQEIVVACFSAVCDDGGQDWAFLERLATLGTDIAALLAT